MTRVNDYYPGPINLLGAEPIPPLQYLLTAGGSALADATPVVLPFIVRAAGFGALSEDSRYFPRGNNARVLSLRINIDPDAAAAGVLDLVAADDVGAEVSLFSGDITGVDSVGITAVPPGALYSFGVGSVDRSFYRLRATIATVPAPALITVYSYIEDAP
jgi:hypothetical protein